ncbi:MAG: diphosphate--fructose-6-phosphate 1-phosphotransferase [Alkalispirochaeta sp.]
MDGNILVGQSGGPTAVINASLAGVIAAARAAGFGDDARRRGRIFGMHFAIEGFLEERLLSLDGLSYRDLDRLRDTPASILGSCRYKIQDEDLPKIHRLLEKYGIRYLFYIGGNDTMDTINRISAYCSDAGYEIRGIGIPKTVDNDLYAVDHTPGFPSAARYVALSVQQAGRLARDMQRVDRFLVHQTIGRDAGWLAAASALARRRPGDAPHMIYLPEQPITRDQVLDDLRNAIDSWGWASIVIGEGTRWDDGTPVSAAAGTDRFNNVEFGAMSGSSAALSLHRFIAAETGYRGEFQVPESMPMAAIDRRGPHDAAEAYACGVEAVRRALGDETGVMITIERKGAGIGHPYEVTYGTAPLGDVAVRARPMPPEMLAPGDVTEVFLEYAAPLAGPLPEYLDLAEAGAREIRL